MTVSVFQVVGLDRLPEFCARIVKRAKVYFIFLKKKNTECVKRVIDDVCADSDYFDRFSEIVYQPRNALRNEPGEKNPRKIVSTSPRHFEMNPTFDLTSQMFTE